MNLLKLLSQETNLAILTLLKNEPTYPRRLSSLLGMTEQKVVLRLRRLEQAGLLRGSWKRAGNKNVKIYEVRVDKFEVVLGLEGLQFVLRPGDTRTALHQPLYVNPNFAQNPDFLGRERELQLLKSSKFAVVEGIAGIGKSSLVQEFALRLPRDYRFFWHTFRETDSFSHIIGKLSSFLAGLDRPDLLDYLKQNGRDDSVKLDLLVRGVDRPKYVLILDDYQRHHDVEIDNLLGYLQRTSRKAKIVVASRLRPSFLKITPTVTEVKLDGFSQEESFRFLEKRRLRIDLETMLYVYAKTLGHPLALLLICAILPKSRRSQVPSWAPAIQDLSSEFLRSLSELERETLAPLSAFRNPIPPEAISEIIGGRRVSAGLYYLERQMFLKRTGKTYFLHELVREASYPMIDYPKELHKKIGEWYMGRETAQEILEGLYHLVKSSDLARVNEVLFQEMTQEKYQFVEKGYSSVLLDVLDPVSTKGLNPKEACCILCIKGKALSSIQKWTRAKTLLLEAKRIAESLDDPKILACVFKSIGKFYLRKGELSTGESNMRKASELFRTTGNIESLRGIYLDLARIHFTSGNLGESQKYLSQLNEVA